MHPRVAERHPEVADEDVAVAMRGMIRYKQRLSGEWLAVGLDGNSRLVELVTATTTRMILLHGMTPSPGKTLRELGLER